MPPNRPPKRARLLAPVALLAFALAVSLVVLGSGGAKDGPPESTETAEQRTTATGPARRAPDRRAPDRREEERSTYTVKPGDTLGKIAEKSGVEVETLQELNPAVDPQALVTGQKLKLRE